MSEQWGVPEQQPGGGQPQYPQGGQPGQPGGSGGYPQGGQPAGQPYPGGSGEYPQAGGYPQQGFDQTGGGVPPFDPQGPYGYAPPPQKQGNTPALLGVIFGVLIFPVGFILSIIGLVISKSRNGAGRTLAIVGLVLSVVVGVGAVAGLVAISGSTAADPGCTTAEGDMTSLLTKLNTDETALANAESSGDTAGQQTALNTFVGDLKTIQSDLGDADSKATHQSVKDKISAMNTDLGTVISGLQAAQSGDTSQETQMEAAAGRLQSDGDAIDNLCTTF